MLKNSWAKIRRFLVSDDGPTAVEYMVMLSLIVIVALVTIAVIGDITSDSYNNTSNSITSSVGP